MSPRARLTAGALGLAALALLAALATGRLGSHEGPGVLLAPARPPAAAGASGEDAIWFGDLHVHTTVSLDAFRASLASAKGGGSRPQAAACDFARACTGLDFFALTDHAENSTPARWSESAASLRECNARTDPAAPDLVGFLGWEWTGRREDGGHWSVLLRDVPAQGVSLRPLGAVSPDPVVAGPPLSVLGRLALVGGHLFDRRAHDFARYLTEGASTPPADRVATPDELAARLRSGAPALLMSEGAVEGSSPATLLDVRTDEGVQALLARGARFGLVAGSDSHDARPGSGGLAAVHAAARERGALFDALLRREVYATSGARTQLWFDLVNAPGDRILPMGSEVSMRHAPRFRVRAAGSPVVTGEGGCWGPGSERHGIAVIDVVRIRPQRQPEEPLGELIADPLQRRFCAPDSPICQIELTDDSFAVDARPAVYYARVLEDGQQRAWSSPIFVDYAAQAQAESRTDGAASAAPPAGAAAPRQIAPDEFDSEWSPAGDEAD